MRKETSDAEKPRYNKFLMSICLDSEVFETVGFYHATHRPQTFLVYIDVVHVDGTNGRTSLLYRILLVKDDRIVQDTVTNTF